MIGILILDIYGQFGIDAGIGGDLAYRFCSLCRNAHPATWDF